MRARRGSRANERGLAAAPISLLALSLLVLGLAAAGCRSGDSLVDEARAKIEAGRAGEALALLRKGLATSPDDPALNLAYGQALIANGQPSIAVWSLTKAGRDPKLADEASLLLARAQMATSSHDEAVATLQAVLDREPDQLDALRLMVDAQLEARQAKQALETVEHALDLAPDDLGLQMSRMRVFLHLDRPEEAAEVLAEIRRRIPELDDLEPSQREFLAGRYCAIEAMFTHEVGDSAKARPLFEKCLAEHPTHPQVIASATQFFDQIGDRDAATEIHRKALAEDPENLEQRVALSIRLDRLGQHDEAEKLLLEVKDSQPDVYSALVDHYVDVDDQRKALDALDHAYEVMGNEVPEDWKTVRADLLIQTGRFDEAERAIAEIKEEVYSTTARGRLALARGEPAKALELLERGIRLWPDGTLARYLAAQAAEQLGDFDRAESEYREAYRSDQAYTDAGLQLAALLASRGLPAEALKLATGHLQAKPDEAVTEADAAGYEQAIDYAIAAKDPEYGRNILAHYQSLPKLRVRAGAYAIRHLLREKRLKDAGMLADGIRTDLSLPESFPLLEARCEVDVARGRAAAALAFVEGLRAKAPARLELQELEAKLLVAKGDREGAKARLGKVLEVEPERASALREMAKLEAAAGEKVKAQALFDRAAKSDARDADSLVAAARLDAPGPERERRLREALRRAPRDGEAAAFLADVLLADTAVPTPEITALLERARRFGAAKQAGEIAARFGAKG